MVGNCSGNLPLLEKALALVVAEDIAAAKLVASESSEGDMFRSLHSLKKERTASIAIGFEVRE